ncbi:LAME_0F17656g1_1 [Lachancea meyersii CBS 8951]|uniref:LAME_0F17656g1_1 n=1 Tax=Lachancea meyersii CBS 8951 TaxID=1266667 RepID=A0A1G4K036_9SACH|nr:LAME_0F17656g1_1 [Lachancea meyersii CBS 8951]
MWDNPLNKYLDFESRAIELLRRVPFLHEYTSDMISARITLFLTTVGLMALVNELYITIEMSFLQKETYGELNRAPLNAEDLKNHRMIIDDEFHGKEWLDEKSGIVMEEFERLDRFFAKPVHVSHLYVECNIIERSQPSKSKDKIDIECKGPDLLSEPFVFHMEFSPEDWELEKRPEFGCKLQVLRRKLYHFFKDSQWHERYVGRHTESKLNEPFTLSSSVQIYNTSQELLPTTVDDIQLCFLKMETGDTIKCKFVV